jgi:hypothetical protein
MSSMSRLMNFGVRAEARLEGRRAWSCATAWSTLVEAHGLCGPVTAGHLQRDVVDVVAREQAGVGGEAAGGLAVAEDGLAEEVDVDAVAARAGVG